MPLDTVSGLDPYSALVTNAFDRVRPAVVHVTCFRPDGKPTGQGSGAIFTPDAYVLTNHHVVAQATRITASMWRWATSSWLWTAGRCPAPTHCTGC